jgi:hypothetical protein
MWVLLFFTFSRDMGPTSTATSGSAEFNTHQACMAAANNYVAEIEGLSSALNAKFVCVHKGVEKPPVQLPAEKPLKK